MTARRTAGTYTGDGEASHAITVPFQPDVVIVKSAAAATGFIRTSTMTSGESKAFANSDVVTDAILSFSATGFTVGANTSINDASQTYYWFAMEADADDCAVFSYTGNGGDDRSVGSFVFTPNGAFVLPDASSRIWWRTDQLAGDLSQDHRAVAIANNIQALGAGTIQVGTGLNANGTVYHAWVWKNAAGLAATTEYAGDGNDNRDIAHTLGATPIFALIQAQNVTAQNIVGRFGDESGDASFELPSAGIGETTDRIQAMGATNVQVGTHISVNSASSTPTYTLATFGEFVVVNPTISTIVPDEGPKAGGTTITITGTGFEADAAVTVGGAAATGENVLNSTTMTAVTPAGTVGAQDVVVTNTDTGTVTEAGGFTYISEGGGVHPQRLYSKLLVRLAV